jgi:hypothetical protein
MRKPRQATVSVRERHYSESFRLPTVPSTCSISRESWRI